MDLRILSQIDDELGSSEVAALCFLCQDIVSKKSLEAISNARELFTKLEENCLLENSSFLYQLLQTIGRADLLSLLEAARQPEETDANPLLSDYRVMLYKLYEGLGREDLANMKFLLNDKLGRRQTEMCNTVLDVFVEMEKKGLLSMTKPHVLHEVLQDVDQRLASEWHHFMQRNRGTFTQLPTPSLTSPRSLEPPEFFVSVPENNPRGVEQNISSDAEPPVRPSPLVNDGEYYSLTHNPRGLCVIFNVENFISLKHREGTMKDEKVLRALFTKFGFTVQVHKDLNADAILYQLQVLGQRNFVNDDALVVCVLSHGDKGCVYGADEMTVSITDVIHPFISSRAPTLAGKPKLFFIQACQGKGSQLGCVPYTVRQAQRNVQDLLEEDAGPVIRTVPDYADFLLGMATVEDYKSFRNITTGSIYIQELCHQLAKSAESVEQDDILSILTRVNREVSNGEYLQAKQMPQPKYTLTKKLVLKYV